MAKLKTDLSGTNSNIRVERAYAKSIGVKSPTVMSKLQLDEAVRLRELELGIAREKQTIYDFAPTEREKLYAQIPPKTSIQMYTGYFVPFKEGDGVLRRDPFELNSELDVYVAKDIVEQYDMHEGDRVVGNVCTMCFNNIRVLKNVRYFNDETTTGGTVNLARYDEIDSVTPETILRIGGNTTFASIVQNVLNMAEGQSLLVTGMDESNKEMFEEIAIDIYTSLNMWFTGDVYGIFNIYSPEGLSKIYKSRNPESMIINGTDHDSAMLMQMIKRSVERKNSAVIVLFNVKDRLEQFISLAKATTKATVTVIAFAEDGGEADIIVPFNGNKIVSNKIRRAISENSSFTIKKAMKIKEMNECTPEEFLNEFMEQFNE